MSEDREDFKTSGLFINVYTFTLWKYKQNTEDNECSTEKGQSYMRSIDG